MRRRRRDLDQIEVPPRFADPHVEDFVTPGEVLTLHGAQQLAEQRHGEAFECWEVENGLDHATGVTVAVPVVFDRRDLESGTVDGEVAMPAPRVAGLTVEQGRALLYRSCPIPFRDRKRFSKETVPAAPLRLNDLAAVGPSMQRSVTPVGVRSRRASVANGRQYS